MADMAHAGSPIDAIGRVGDSEVGDSEVGDSRGDDTEGDSDDSGESLGAVVVRQRTPRGADPRGNNQNAAASKRSKSPPQRPKRPRLSSRRCTPTDQDTVDLFDGPGGSPIYNRSLTLVRESRGARERIRQEGVDKLTDAELVSAVLGTGYSGVPIARLASELLQEGSLDALAKHNLADLRRLRGLGLARACQLLAAFEIGRRVHGHAGRVDSPIRGPRDVLPLVHAYARAPKEHFLAVLLNTRHLPLGVEVISIGSLNASIVHPREVFRPAIVAGAASLILAHNHPSGDPTPSADDLEITQRLRRTGEMLGIEILDHLIMGRGEPLSMREKGLL